ncbi:MAG: hypothetical protein IPJ82_07630 [Lewinellaceae bacterium]|nr:hypothetical protein [Lewinellaceae bacterium]
MAIRNSIVFQTTGTLSAWELKNFRKWLQSPFHNARPELAGLFDYLVRCIRDDEAPAPETAFHTVFAGQVFDEKKLRHALSWLMAQVRAFFTWQELQSDGNQRNVYAARSFRKRNLEAGLRQVMREAKTETARQAPYSAESQLADFYLNFEQYQWDIDQKRAQDMPFDALSGALTTFYATKLLQLGCTYTAQQALQKQSPQTLPRLDLVLSAFSEDTFLTVPQTALYYCGYLMLSNPDEKWKEQFRRLLEQHGHQFPVEEARDLLMMAINYCIRRINQGEREYLGEVLEFYNLGLQNRLLLDERGFLRKYTYNNVLLTMAAGKLWERAAEFLEVYREQLSPDERDSVYRYNRAVFLFQKADYGDAQEILRDLSFSDPMYNLEARRMLLRIYYEENSHDALESLLDNLLTWLRRHGEIGYHREMYRNLARFTGKLLNIPHSEREKRQKLAKKILDTPLVADRQWLLNKVKGTG